MSEVRSNSQSIGVPPAQAGGRSPGNGHASVRLFRSDFLERLTHTSVVTIIVFWTIAFGSAFIGGVRIGRLGLGDVLLATVGGIATWSLFEYLMHRFIFHLDRWIPAARGLAHLIHGCHHEDPADASRDIMPLLAAVPFFAGSFAVGILIFGPAVGLVFEASFGFAYLAYDVTHYACHQWRLPGRWAARVKRHHLVHHYVDSTRNFGVTSPLWDRVFATSAAPSSRVLR